MKLAIGQIQALECCKVLMAMTTILISSKITFGGDGSHCIPLSKFVKFSKMAEAVKQAFVRHEDLGDA